MLLRPGSSRISRIETKYKARQAVSLERAISPNTFPATTGNSLLRPPKAETARRTALVCSLHDISLFLSLSRTKGGTFPEMTVFGALRSSLIQTA